MIDNNICNRLTTFITEIDAKCRSNCYILLAGDFNSRTSDSPDYVVDDSNNSNLDFLSDDYIADVEIKRYTQDKGRINNNGYQLLDLCTSSGLRIVNGRMGADKYIGKCTFVGHRGSSLVDYVICSPDLFLVINYFHVNEP